MDYDTLVTKIARNPDLLLINIMAETDYNKAHIPGSLNMPLDSDSFVGDIDFYADSKSDEIILYADNENMSLILETAADKLTENGFQTIQFFEGGLAEWTKNGGPVKSYDPPESSGGCGGSCDCSCG
ncbi:MAG: rhodanese-like domain-containing protein [Alphaproteobacteria bacterium]|jgi:rhodanese-related sulfurtransferase|nr:rhodanese-like domain-containing protein [Alphaproteobacteria bacterium]MDP7222922.1 rhodanese-like domain-containing protein [Alphaproteobacteria bacterium]